MDIDFDRIDALRVIFCSHMREGDVRYCPVSSKYGAPVIVCRSPEDLEKAIEKAMDRNFLRQLGINASESTV